MHVLYLNTEDLSRDVSSGRVHFWALAKWMARAGCRVTISAPRYRGAIVDVPPPLGRLLFAVPFKNSVSLFLFECLLFLSLPWIALRHRPDVVLVRGGGPGWIPGLVFLGFRLFGIPVVLECNGITWLEFAERGFSSAVVWMVRRSAWQQAWTCNRLIAVTREIGDAYCALAGRPLEDAVEIPNGVDPTEFQLTEESRRLARKRFGIGADQCVAGYVGSFSVWHGIPEIIDAAEILRSRGTPEVLFVLIGKGERFAFAHSEQARLDLPNLRLEGSARNREELRDWMSCFDIGLCTNHPVHSCSPLKFFEYLACGIPVVASGSPQMLRLIDIEGSGIRMDSPSGAEIADAVAAIRRDAHHWREVGRENRRLAEQTHSWQRVAERVIGVMTDVLRR